MTHKLFIGAAAAAALSLSALPSSGRAQTASTSTTGTSSTTTGTTSSSSSTTSSSGSSGTATTAVGTGTAIGPTLLPATIGATPGPGIAAGVTPYQPAGVVGGAFGGGGYQPASALGGGPIEEAPIVETDPSIAAGIRYTLQAGDTSASNAASVGTASAGTAVRSGP
jgi:hypothetical protein